MLKGWLGTTGEDRRESVDGHAVDLVEEEDEEDAILVIDDDDARSKEACFAIIFETRSAPMGGSDDKAKVCWFSECARRVALDVCADEPKMCEGRNDSETTMPR